MATTAGVRAAGRADVGRGSLRRDRWWVTPGITAVVLLAFVVYATWRAFSGVSYYASPYLSPFYSPCLASSCPEGASHATFFGTWWTLSPALLVLVFPLGFRLTCYYYRRAYYRSFWLSPPACAVPEPRRSYTGESRFPLIVQNAHRWFLYVAIAYNVVLTADAVVAFRNPERQFFHAGLGTLVLCVNATLLWLYTLSCHSCRHAVGGRLNHFSQHPLRYRFWTLVSRLNRWHLQLAWVSLFGVALTDLYVYLVASGTITDVRFF